jgi:hypothetical protein
VSGGNGELKKQLSKKKNGTHTGDHMNPLNVTAVPTAELVTLAGMPCRVWRGTTAAGVPCKLFVARVAVEEGHDQGALQTALIETAAPDVRPLA